MKKLSPEAKEQLASLEAAIKKHKHLAAWGNVESKQRLKILRECKRDLLNGEIY
jgi:hypothetical protein